jgi:hypothetical protein
MTIPHVSLRRRRAIGDGDPPDESGEGIETKSTGSRQF